MRPSSRTLPSDSGAPRCGQKSSSAETAPPSARNRTMRSPQIVRPSGLPAISSGVQATYQAFLRYMRISRRKGARAPIVGNGDAAGGGRATRSAPAILHRRHAPAGRRRRAEGETMTLRSELADRVLTLRLDRPKRLNAIDEPTARALLE